MDRFALLKAKMRSVSGEFRFFDPQSRCLMVP